MLKITVGMSIFMYIKTNFLKYLQLSLFTG
jgi:hypothetical protein